MCSECGWDWDGDEREMSSVEDCEIVEAPVVDRGVELGILSALVIEVLAGFVIYAAIKGLPMVWRLL